MRWGDLTGGVSQTKTTFRVRRVTLPEGAQCDGGRTQEGTKLNHRGVSPFVEEATNRRVTGAGSCCPKWVGVRVFIRSSGIKSVAWRLHCQYEKLWSPKWVVSGHKSPRRNAPDSPIVRKGGYIPQNLCYEGRHSGIQIKTQPLKVIRGGYRNNRGSGREQTQDRGSYLGQDNGRPDVLKLWQTRVHEAAHERMSG